MSAHSHPHLTAPLVAIAASTGGPLAIRRVLSELGEVPAPVVVVQHLHLDFSDGFARWLGDATPASVELMSGPVTPRAGHVYVAPGGRHVRLAATGQLILTETPVALHRPSADELFLSLARHAGSAAIAALLTGMGDDGARGLAALRAAGGATFAQDEATSVVYGMPRAALEHGAVVRGTALDRIAPALIAEIRARSPR